MAANERPNGPGEMVVRMRDMMAKFRGPFGVFTLLLIIVNSL